MVQETAILPDMIVAGIQALREEKDREASERDTVLAVYCAMHAILSIQAVNHDSRVAH